MAKRRGIESMSESALIELLEMRRKPKTTVPNLTAEKILYGYATLSICRAFASLEPGPGEEEVWKRKVSELTSGIVLPDNEVRYDVV